MEIGRYSLAVSSKVALQASGHLHQSARELGNRLAADGHILLTPIDLNLSYAVAEAMHGGSGLSVGFSRGKHLREHLVHCNLPTDAYDLIFYTGQSGPDLLNKVISQGQGLILVGGVLENITELTQALARFVPVAILVDGIDHGNNEILKYLNNLPLEKQKQIVLHHEVKVLLEAFYKVLDDVYEDLNDQIRADNNRLFQKILKDNQDSA